MCVTISNNTDTDTTIGDLGQVLAIVFGENEDEWNVSSALTRIKKLRKCPHNIHFRKMRTLDCLVVWSFLPMNVLTSIYNINEFVLEKRYHVFDVQSVFDFKQEKYSQ